MRLMILFISMVFLVLQPVLAQERDSRYAGARNVPTVGFDLQPDAIERRIELYFLSNYRENHDDVVLEYNQIPESITVDPKDWDIKVETRNDAVKKGSNLVEVTIFSREDVYKRFVADVRLRTYDDMVVSNSMMDKKHKLQPEDLSIKRIESTNLRRKYFIRTKELVNLQTRQMIPEGKPIFADQIELPDLIRRGDLVKILIRFKNLEVTATGEAMEAGRLGDDISVENLSTGKKITGQIHDEKTVIVEL